MSTWSVDLEVDTVKFRNSACDCSGIGPHTLGTDQTSEYIVFLVFRHKVPTLQLDDTYESYMGMQFCLGNSRRRYLVQR